MLISMIVAMAANRCIGRDGRLPWHLPGDLQRFKQLTMGHSLLMGRKTFDSIGHPLHGRSSYILSRNPELSISGCHTVNDLDVAIDSAKSAGETELFICGGEDIYRQTLPLCDRIYLTELEREVAGDRFFPEVPLEQFSRIRHLQLCAAEQWRFSVLQRKQLL